MEQKNIGDMPESSLKIVSVLGKGIYDSSTSLENDSTLGRSYLKKTSTLKHSEKLERELKVMLHFNTNPFTVQASCPHLHFETNTEGVTLCYIYMEYASLGNLDKMISDAGGKLPEVTIRRATRMILQGLKALHSEGYVHCDLKPSNVFVFPSNTPGEPWDLKLTGFGLSKEPTMDSSLLFPGTLEYLPPESTGEGCRLFGKDLLIGPARDIWSLGCTVLKMFGSLPHKMGHRIAWEIERDISPVATDFWLRCSELRPRERPTVDELLDHPFVAEKLPSFHEVSLFHKEQCHGRYEEFIPKPHKEQLHGRYKEFIPKPQDYGGWDNWFGGSSF